MAALDKMLLVCVCGLGPKAALPNSCVLVPVSRHLVHSTHNAGTRGWQSDVQVLLSNPQSIRPPPLIVPGAAAGLG